MTRKRDPIECSICHHMNGPGVVYCERCGNQLFTTAPQDALDGEMIPPNVINRFEAVDDLSDTVRVEKPHKPKTEGGASGVFGAQMMLRLQLQDMDDSVVIRPFRDKDMVFGRHDPETAFTPEIDLMSYGGYRMGISRRHAALYLSGKRLTVRDLGSSNGTLLNGIKLDPHEEHQLRDGDELRMGNLIFMVHFEEVV